MVIMSNPKKEDKTKEEEDKTKEEEGKTKELVEALNSFKDDLTLDCIMNLQSAAADPFFMPRSESTSISEKKDMCIHKLFEAVMTENKVKTDTTWYKSIHKKLKSIYSKNRNMINDALHKKEKDFVESAVRAKTVKKVCEEVKKVFSAGIFAKVMGKKDVTSALKGICNKIKEFENNLPKENDTNPNNGEKYTQKFICFRGKVM